MPQFSKQGENEQDFWLVDGSVNFGFMPALEGFPALPIRLQVGTPVWGEIHMRKHRNEWGKPWWSMEPAQLLKMKLSSGSGSIFTTELENKKKVLLRLKPSALLVMQHRFISTGEGEEREYFWSVTTLYINPRNLDGEHVGNYSAP